MGRILACTVIALLVLVSGGCRKKVNLVKEWRLEGATKVVLVRQFPDRTITLSSAQEVRRFVKFFRKGVRGPDYVEMLCPGFGEIHFEDRPACRFGVLLSSKTDPKPKMAVQRFVEGKTESYYYLPKGFVKFWQDRLGPEE